MFINADKFEYKDNDWLLYYVRMLSINAQMGFKTRFTECLNPPLSADIQYAHKNSKQFLNVRQCEITWEVV